MKSRNANLATTLSRIALGVLFIFSGITKAINPFGLSIQFGDYFEALSLDFLEGLAPVAAITLPALETLLGLMLLGGIYRRVSYVASFWLMSFFTLLTLWIAIYNPVSDCGCFGDLWKISNWATFSKNIVFMIPALILFRARKQYKGKIRVQNMQLAAYTCLSFVLPLYSSFNLPLIDATPFKLGVNIPHELEQAMVSTPTGKTILIYKNLETGESHEFEVSDTTWYDTNKWEFVDSRTQELEQITQEVSGISSLPLINAQGEDLHQEVLSSAKVLLVVSNTPQAIDFKQLEMLRNQGVRVVLVSSSPLESLPQGFESYNSDFTLIRTMIQHPAGGALLLENGIIAGKWTMDELPETL